MRPPADGALAERGPRLALSPAGAWLTATGLLWVATGVLLALPAMTALGGLTFVCLAWGYAVAALARAELGSGAVRVAVEVEPEGLRVPVGRTTRLPLRLWVGGRLRPRQLQLLPGAVAPLLAVIEPDGMLALRPPRVGDAWVHGFSARLVVAGGLYAVRGWIPAPIRLCAMPRHFPLGTAAPLRATRTSLQAQAGLAFTRQRGLGMELRELRDHQPGDPFKHIAWRATARRGKLISREFESDLVLSTWILVDASPSMFWGTPGQARIDFALETAYNLAAALISRGDRAGILVHDHRVLHQLAPALGRRQLLRILDVLLEVPHLVLEGRTENTERELVERVARYFEAQEALSLRLPEGLLAIRSPRQTDIDEGRLVEVARARLREMRAAATARQPLVAEEAYATDAREASLRALCRHAGIPLLLDPTPVPGGQATGIEAAIDAVLRVRGGPHTLVAISDLYTADDLDTLKRAALAARRKRHAMIVFCPDDPRFDLPLPQDADPLARAVVEVERLRVHQALSAPQTALRPAGVTFVRCGPDDVIPRLLQRLRMVA